MLLVSHIDLCVTDSMDQILADVEKPLLLGAGVQLQSSRGLSSSSGFTRGNLHVTGSLDLWTARHVLYKQLLPAHRWLRA